MGRSYEESKIEYLNYITEHIGNVVRAFNEYGKELCEVLAVDYKLLKSLIDLHDESKFEEEEFEAYRQYFYTADGEEKDQRVFDLAWEHHYRSNPHHPLYWKTTSGYADMTPGYIAEMLLDWQAMGYKFGDSAYEFYHSPKSEEERSCMTPKTKELVEEAIKLFK